MKFVSTTYHGTGYSQRIPLVDDIFTFADLQEALSHLPYQQIDGQPMASDEEGNEYRQVFARILARPLDVAQLEARVCQDFYSLLTGQIAADQMKSVPLGDADKGILRWRTRPEFYSAPSFVVTSYKEDGPDRCDNTDRRCVKDHNWVLIKVYGRYSFTPLRRAVAA